MKKELGPVVLGDEQSTPDRSRGSESSGKAEQLIKGEVVGELVLGEDKRRSSWAGRLYAEFDGRSTR